MPSSKVSKKLINYAIFALTLTSNNTFTKIVIENASGKKIVIRVDKKIGTNWDVITPYDKITVDTTSKGARGFYWATADNLDEFCITPKFTSPDIITIKPDRKFDIKESLKNKMLNQTTITGNFAVVKQKIAEAEGSTTATKDQPRITSANPKSVELKVTSDKTSFVEKEIKIMNVSQTNDIYVYVDCNYKTATYGGGYDRKTAAKKISKHAATGYFSFFVYAPKSEEIAIRWTTNPDLKTANWYETQYKNYDNEKNICIDIYDNGKYEDKDMNLEVTGIKIVENKAFPITKTTKETFKQANEIIFKKADTKVQQTPER
jgi:hypothetical protein